MSGPAPPPRNLASILVRAGVVTDEQVERGLARQRETGRRIGESLVEMGFATEQDIAWALAHQLGLPFVDVVPETLDVPLLRDFSDGLLRRLQAVPLVRAGDDLTVAFADPTDLEALAELERAAGCRLLPSVATPTSIASALDAVFGAQREDRAAPGLGKGPSGVHYDVLWERSGATFVLFHLSTALKRGAHEIHFLPDRGQLHVLYRIGPDLRAIANEPLEVLPRLLARIEALGGPALGERDLHVHGGVVCPLAGEDIDVDVALTRGTSGIAVTLCPRPTWDRAPDVNELGIDPADAASLRAVLDQPAGLVLVGGPPRSGGSTTLAALLGATGIEPSSQVEERGVASAHGRRVILFESRPIAPVPLATRIHADDATLRDRWQGIAVSQSADVVVLDGTLSGESVEAVLSPIASGRLVLARTDWTDSFSLLEFLLSRPQGRLVLPQRLLAMVQQRLVRMEVPEGERATTPFLPGLVAIFEVLVASESFRTAIGEGADTNRLRQIAREDGFRPLSFATRARVSEGNLPAPAARAAA